MKVLLLTPPMVQVNTPYPATAYLTGFLRQHEARLGLEVTGTASIQALAEDVAPILLATRINYRRPVTISDPLVGRMRVAGLGRVRWRLAAEFTVGDLVHAEAEQEGLFMRLSTRRPIAIPEPIRRWHGG